jgi:death-on-curing protein
MIFLRKSEVIVLQAASIDRFGGLHGIRDEGALESALIAVENRYHYESADIAICAATYAYHLCQAHAFIDGNKRVAAAATEVFLAFNNAKFTATNDQIVDFFLGIASGAISRDKVEPMLRDWITY